MSDTKQRLSRALLKISQSDIAELWKVCEEEAGRRVNGTRNIPLADFAKVLDHMGVQLVFPEENLALIPKKELSAIRLLAQSSRLLSESDDEAEA